jgi:predicted lipase
MSYDQRKSLREKLDKISHKQDMRRAAKEINDEGRGSSYVQERINATVAHWAEQILQEHYGSSNYGFTVTSSRKGNKVLLENDDAYPRTEPTELRSPMELERDYVGAVGFAREGDIKEMKDLAVEWFETEAVRVADEALDKIRRIREQQMMR